MSNFNICRLNDIITVKQDKYYYCAAASLKMCLNLSETQDQIFSILAKDTVDKEHWYAEPDAVYIFLKKYRECERTSDFAKNSLEATESIVSNLIQNNKPFPMLISHGKHWVVYVGYQLDENGKPTGIYIKDPWPTTASLSFFPFSNYFFNEYFNFIEVNGKMKNKVESFYLAKTNKCITIDIFNKPSGGGMNLQDISFFKNEILNNDFKKYGLPKISMPKYGGNDLEDIVIYDKSMNMKFYLTFAELNTSLII